MVWGSGMYLSHGFKLVTMTTSLVMGCFVNTAKLDNLVTENVSTNIAGVVHH